MTLDEIRDRIWDNLGKPTDLDPDTDTQFTGAVPLLTWYANEGQRQIAFWRDPYSGRRLRFNSLKASLNYRSHTQEDTVAAVSNSDFPYYIDLTSADTNDDQFNDWLLVIGAEAKIIADYDGTNRRCYIHDAFASDPSVSDTAYLYKNFDFLLPSTHDWIADHIELPSETDIYRADGNLFEVLSIADLTNGRELRKMPDNEKFLSSITSYGDPTSWLRYSNKIIYDYAVDSDIWFKMEYYRSPKEMAHATSTTDIPELPEIFHYAIVLWGTWHGLKRTGEVTAAKVVWSDLVNYMRSTVLPRDVEADRLNAHGSVLYDWRNY
jgi:hypothetical protein